jgi:hypothetical protein
MPKYLWVNFIVGLVLGIIGYALGAIFGLPSGSLRAGVGQESPQTLLNDFLENQKNAEGGAGEYFCKPEGAQTFFALRDWEIISEKPSDKSGIFTVRIESSTKGGMPIIKNWNFFITESEGTAHKYCIITISES